MPACIRKEDQLLPVQTTEPSEILGKFTQNLLCVYFKYRDEMAVMDTVTREAVANLYTSFRYLTNNSANTIE